MDRDTTIALVFALLFVAVGGYLTYDHYRQQRQHEPVDGEIIETNLTHSRDGADPHISYRYTVEGTQYTSSNICPGQGDHGCHGDARTVVDRYESGQQVTVYVDPDDPSDAYLLHGKRPTAAMVAAAVGFVFTVLIVYADIVKR